MMREERFQRLRRLNQMAQRRKKHAAKVTRPRRRDALLKYYRPVDPTPSEVAWMSAHGTSMIPYSVRDAWDKKREAEVPDVPLIDQFIRDECVVGEPARCRPSALLDAYLEWCKKGRRQPMGSKTFYLYVGGKFKAVRSTGKRMLVGVSPC